VLREGRKVSDTALLNWYLLPSAELEAKIRSSSSAVSSQKPTCKALGKTLSYIIKGSKN